MKRVLSTAVLLIALFVMVACGRSGEEPELTPTAIPAIEEVVAEEAVTEESRESESESEAAAEEEVEATDADEATDSDNAVAEESSESEGESEAAAEEEVEATDADEAADSDDAVAEEEAAEEAKASQGLGSMITVLLNDLFFGETNDNVTNPPVWTVGSGEEVMLTMQNRSVAVKHNWAVVKQGAEVSVPYNPETDAEMLLYESGLVDAESEAELTFTAPDVGEYLVICTEPGHSVLMQGKLVVE